MTTTNGNRKILDLKRWELCAFNPIATGAGSFTILSRHVTQTVMYFPPSLSTPYLYSVDEDAFMPMVAHGLVNNPAAGSTGVATAFGPSNTCPLNGTSTTVQVNEALGRDLRGYKVRILAGPGAGDTRTIASNTLSTITVTSAFSAAPTTGSTYQLITPRFYVVCQASTAPASFRMYDWATNTWSTVTANAPASLSGDSKMVATPSFIGDDYKPFATGTASAGGASTITDSTKNWDTNQWANSQVRITGGTGIGQIRTVSSNTATVITVSAAWATQPDNTSTYAIEGNDDFLYLFGNSSNVTRRYQISTNTWTTLTNRNGATGSGLSGQWVYEVPDADWTAESTIKNGRYIYSFRGGGVTSLDVYDIAANSWATSSPASLSASEVPTTGWKYSYGLDGIYCLPGAGGSPGGTRVYRFNVPKNQWEPFSHIHYLQSTAQVGDTMFNVSYKDGATRIEYVYVMLNGSNVLMRCMVI